MAHTRSQDLEAHFTTLHSNFIETQQEVRQISANITTINQNMPSSMIRGSNFAQKFKVLEIASNWTRV
jgi:hypothetical protein